LSDIESLQDSTVSIDFRSYEPREEWLYCKLIERRNGRIHSFKFWPNSRRNFQPESQVESKTVLSLSTLSSFVIASETVVWRIFNPWSRNEFRYYRKDESSKFLFWLRTPPKWFCLAVTDRWREKRDYTVKNALLLPSLIDYN